MSVQRECCNYCMWYGPINKDGNMRKHRPATLDNKWGQPNKVQDMTAVPCPGSNKPHATFDCETAATPQAEPQEPTVTDIDFTPGQRIVVADGTIQTVAKMSRWSNEPVRVEVEGGLQWLAAECVPVPERTDATDRLDQLRADLDRTTAACEEHLERSRVLSVLNEAALASSAEALADYQQASQATTVTFSMGSGGRYRSAPINGVVYELEKRRRNLRDGCPDTGWYLYGGGHFGTWCASTIAEAVAEANNEILAKPPVAADDEELGCADCARPNDGTWPIGSDICCHCWDHAENEEN